MRNTNAFTLCLVSFVAGIFGFFLRWLQLLNGFEDGLAIPGATIATVFALYSLVVVLLFAGINLLLLKKRSFSTDPCVALTAGNIIPRLIMWAVAALMAIACLILMFSSDFARYPTMQRLTAALGIFAALCLPFLLRKKGSEEAGFSSSAALIPVLFGCLWLVTAYRVESENPILWSYVLEMLAIVAVTLSFYYIAAYFYGRAKPLRCVFSMQISTYLCMCTLMDSHSLGEKLLFGCLAAAMLVLEFVLFCSAAEKADK